MKRKVTTQHAMNALDCAGLMYSQLRVDYSGRYMYGDNCMGIVGDGEDGMRFLLYLTAEVVLSEDHDTDVNMANAIDQFIRTYEGWPETRVDSMGLSSIIYWPDMQLEDPEEWKEENDQD